MSWLLFSTVILGLIMFIRQLLPLPSLKHIDYEDFLKLQSGLHEFKVIDIRDAVEYTSEPTTGTINISLGRLPYVWQKYLVREENVFILSNGVFKSKKAARILRKHGFRCLYVIMK